VVAASASTLLVVIYVAPVARAMDVATFGAGGASPSGCGRREGGVRAGSDRPSAALASREAGRLSVTQFAAALTLFSPLFRALG
jgi:hypothetical protein